MKIIVCVKHVPDTETRVVVGPDNRSIDETDVKFVMNPYDEYAVEQALRIKEQTEDTEIMIVTLGPEDAQSSIRTAMAMGADSGVLLKVENSALADGLSIARALAGEIKLHSPDMILTGKMAIDGYGHQVATMLGELLDIPVLSTAKRFELQGSSVRIKRDIEGGRETVKADLPCVLTAEKGLNEPRYPALKGIMQAKKKPLEVKEMSLEGEGLEILEMTYPPQKPPGRIVGEGPEAAEELVRLLRDQAQVL